MPMIKYEKNGKYGIKISQISMEQFDKTDDIEKETNICSLFWTKQNENILISFYSSIKEIQALEFMDYLVHNYVIVRGNAVKAQAVLDAVFLQAMQMELEENTIEDLLEKITENYFTECTCIYAEEFVRENKDAILEMESFTKKRIPWAYVKTTDVLQAGEKFYLKSLENQSRIIIEASEDIYIMIGQHGEIYHMNREKFEKTYEASEEYLDIFEKMLDYIPEIQRCDDGEFVSLDETAHLCYPKTSGGVFAIPLTGRTKVFNPYNNGEYFLGQKGDYMIIRKDDWQDIYVIQKDIFQESYEKG